MAAIRGRRADSDASHGSLGAAEVSGLGSSFIFLIHSGAPFVVVVIAFSANKNSSEFFLAPF
jgi:hypothetical protein